eukprot:1190046-Prorocentrum_minimum.AAC.1
MERFTCPQQQHESARTTRSAHATTPRSPTTTCVTADNVFNDHERWAVSASLFRLVAVGRQRTRLYSIQHEHEQGVVGVTSTTGTVASVGCNRGGLRRIVRAHVVYYIGVYTLSSVPRRPRTTKQASRPRQKRRCVTTLLVASFDVRPIAIFSTVRARDRQSWSLGAAAAA